MNKKEKYIIYISFMLIYIALAIYNFVRGSQFIIDNIVAIIFLTFIFLINKWLKLQKFGFVLFNIALLAHNMGTFGFYSWTWKIFAYDNIVHLLSSAVAAYIIFNFIARKLHIKENQRVKNTVVDEHKVVFIFLVIASVAMLGTIVELIEFVGFLHFGSEKSLGGLLNVDAEGSDIAKEYIDTMSDIVTNTIGSISGVVLYYHIKYKRRPWLKY